MKTIKLVRDNAKERYPNDTFKDVDTDMHRVLLLKKLHEEVEEISRDQTDILEYADVYECLKVLAALNGITMEQIVYFAEKKAKVKGSFEKGVVWVKN